MLGEKIVFRPVWQLLAGATFYLSGVTKISEMPNVLFLSTEQIDTLVGKDKRALPLEVGRERRYISD